MIEWVLWASVSSFNSIQSIDVPADDEGLMYGRSDELQFEEKEG